MIARRSESGFTLVEALAACSIVALVAALGVGMLRTIVAGNDRAGAIAAAVEASERARLLAATAGQSINLRAGTRFTLISDDDSERHVALPSGWEAALYKESASAPLRSVESVVFSDVAAAPGFVVVLTGRDGGAATVRVLAVSGQPVEEHSP